MTQYNIFIGFDEREKEAYEVCRHSIFSTLENPEDREKVSVFPLEHRLLRRIDMFQRIWHLDVYGDYLDIGDNRPFSTQFSHSRFLTPHYANYLGLKGQAMFVDPDFLFCDSVINCFEQAKETGKLVSVVQHKFKPTTKIKMDNRSQRKYDKKLWSSLMVFDMERYKEIESILTAKDVSLKSGMFLHQFKWLTSDEEIGSLDERWNFIPNHSEERIKDVEIGAIHYTERSPWFPQQEDCDYALWWWEEYEKWVHDDLLIRIRQNINKCELPNVLLPTVNV